MRVHRDPIYPAIGVVLRRRREALGWSARELARRVGCRPHSVLEHERALHASSLRLIREYATAMRCSWLELLAEAEREIGKARAA